MRTIDPIGNRFVESRVSSGSDQAFWEWKNDVYSHVKPEAEPKITERRRGKRLNSRVPVAIEWEGGEAKKSSREETFTRVVGPCGCLVLLDQELNVDQEVRVFNLATSESSSAVIVWKGDHRTDGWELGIELIRPATDFWGLEL